MCPNYLSLFINDYEPEHTSDGLKDALEKLMKCAGVGQDGKEAVTAFFNKTGLSWDEVLGFLTTYNPSSLMSGQFRSFGRRLDSEFSSNEVEIVKVTHTSKHIQL